jgi:hypothetical protein
MAKKTAAQSFIVGLTVQEILDEYIAKKLA